MAILGSELETETKKSNVETNYFGKKEFALG
jgi:hypothetical protein